MIEYGRCEGTTRDVADVAILRRRHMRRIDLGVLTGGIDAVVAGVTPCSPHLGTVMVDKRVGKVGRVMTHGTVTAGVLMNRRVRRRSGIDRPGTKVLEITVVARDTITGNTRVRKSRFIEHGNRVTAVAILGRRYVVCRLQELRRVRQEFTLMTPFTTTGDAIMDRSKERRRCEYTRGIVTHAAIFLCGDMNMGTHHTGFVDGDTCVMTGRTIVGIYAHMAEGDIRKSGEVTGIVASRTVQGRGQMIQGLSKRDVTIMALRAITAYTRMIK